jgi:thiosulfate dehydrogenase
MSGRVLAALGAGAAVGAATMWLAAVPKVLPVMTADAAKPAFAPPRAADAPIDAYGDAVRLGVQLVTDTAAVAPAYVGNGLVCSNCHLDAGRKAGAAPLWAAFVNFPAFRNKNGEINSFPKRVQD